ncbi:VOC family protein [Acidovorax sp.]|uniref:VOC family protein n=1 Tax=Acidovorax sp. TaxID=1872122 RepID=UPI00391EF5A2
MQIKLASVLVDDQEKALKFYTEQLGFVKDKDIPMGTFRWLTVNSPDGAEGVELVLEPMAFAPAATYQRALFEAGIPATAFITKAWRATTRGSRPAVWCSVASRCARGRSPWCCWKIPAAT